MTDALLKIKSLVKVFTKKQGAVLHGITAEFEEGKIIALAGPDGAGKTTLIRLIAGLLLPTHGSVHINGYDSIKEAQKIHEIISYMPQKFGLYEDLTVLQNLELYADLHGINQEEKEKQFEKLLHFTNLKSFTGRLAGKLSGGMKQKLGLACTLLRTPKLLLLDEPTVGVDPISRRELWAMIFELVAEKITVLCSTAYLDEVERCNEVLLLNEGKILYAGEPDKLTAKLQGKTFQIQGIETNRRKVLSKAINTEGVIDGVIQGSAVRIITKKPLDLKTLSAGERAIIKEVPPRFEDAYMDILGGGPKGESPLLKILPAFPKEDKPIVEAVELTKRFGNFTAANKLSFSVKRGEIFGLLGPNGAGKSTTFKMLCGLLQPTFGKAFVAGLSLQEAPSQARGRIGYMAQKFSLYGNMTVLQNLNFFSGIYATESGNEKEMVQKMIEIFYLEPYINTAAQTLPLGFKQRLALACAIMHKPEVLFLDEPTSGVDPITRREFWSHINGMVERGVAIVVTTHFMDEAEYCDRIALVNHGDLISIGTPDELKGKVVSKELPSPTLEDAFIILSKEGGKSVT